MNKKTVKITAALLLAVMLVVSAFACDKREDEAQRSRYEITAVLDEDCKKIDATMKLDYANITQAYLDEVCLHLYPAAFREGARFSPVPQDMISAAYPSGLDFGSITINSVKLGGESVETVINGQDEDILVVSLEGNELLPGERVTIEVEFSLDLPAVRHRFGSLDGTVNLGNWYPIACVFEDGNFVTDPYYSSGDPFYSDCADYAVSLTVPKDKSVAATGSGRVEESEQTKTYHLTAKNVRDFAAVVGEFQVKGGSADGVNVNYYYISDPTPELSLAAAVDSVRTFNALFGAYPYADYSVVETNFLHGGMEYPALSMISNLVTPDLYREVIIHETAHQWWYGAVGNNEVAHAWMDEGLAEFSTSVFYERNPDYGVEYEKRIADALGAYVLYFDAFKNLNADTSMTRKISEYSDGFEYTYMTYVKGELMFESLRRVLGDEAFFGGLQAYYADYKFKNARPDDLIGCFERTTGKQLKPFFDSWLDGKVSHFGGSLTA